MKYIFYIFFSLFSNLINAQILLEPDMNDPNYERHLAYNDSLSKIKIKIDTTSMYKILSIDDLNEEFYVVMASGYTNDGEEFLYKIKSLKVDEKCKSCKDIIEIGKYYQLDLRDFSSHNIRLHFRKGIGLNLMNTDSFSHFDIIIFIDDITTKHYFNTALNLKGLCIIPHPLLE